MSEPSRELPLVLEVTSPQGQSTRYELSTSPLVVGRLAESDIQLDGQRVSRRHAQLERNDADQWTLRDLASRNGTKINGHPIIGQVLGKDDLIEIGQFQLRILWPAEQQAPENHGQTTLWSMDDPDATDFRTLSSAPAPRLSASHLAKVNALNQRLLDISDSRQRLIELCQTLIAPDMNCNCAVALRVSRTAEAPAPQLLCPHQLRAGQPQPPGISRAVVEAAIADQQPLVAGGAISSGLTVHFSEAERGVTAIIACPLHVEAASADILYATVPHDCGTLDWLALVALAAEQYKKAELQIEARKTTQDNAAIRNELKKARKIQMSLVPRNPTAPGLEIAIGFEPCLWIGGDYANVLPAPDERVFLIVADVSGKGLPAAMIATGVHSIVDASVNGGQSLSELAQGLNRFLIESMDRQSYLTVLAVLFDPRTGRAQCLNAGHPPMFIINPTGKLRELTWGHNPPLGVLATSPLIDFAELHPGELLFMYTDGLTEMYDADGKMLYVAGVKSHIAALYAAHADLPLDALRDKLSQTLDQIRGASPITDDRTFLLARRL
ncbi:MAG TPA: SpoIIE family protein phosphatase [Tepidisphaeraceae bacterium]|nr:SpoIIE family protein phosphatase [Tepidisphaeraceae bacterium]